MKPFYAAIFDKQTLRPAMLWFQFSLSLNEDGRAVVASEAVDVPAPVIPSGADGIIKDCCC